jgi:hypothetical protein
MHSVRCGDIRIIPSKNREPFYQSVASFVILRPNAAIGYHALIAFQKHTE